jgi:hypothetical protein
MSAEIAPAQLASNPAERDNARRGSPMRWLLVSLAAGLAGAALLVVRRRFGGGRPDVGAVSDQWIATHRAEPSDH